jgi:hypothetical protein
LTRRKEASSLILEDLPLAAELAEPARLLCLAIVCSFVLVFFGISLSPHAALHDLINVSRILWKGLSQQRAMIGRGTCPSLDSHPTVQYSTPYRLCFRRLPPPLLSMIVGDMPNLSSLWDLRQLRQLRQIRLLL